MTTLPNVKTRVAAAVLTGLSFSAIAEEKEIEVVNVWGTEIKASSIYLNSDDIVTKQADHISDLLRAIPGVDVGGAHSLNQRITIRSMDDKDIRISIDGAVQNTYMYHHMGNLQIHADILKSVDIEVGTNSVITGGLGGAVRFETKQAAELLTQGQRVGGRVEVMGSSNAGHKYSFTGYGLLTENVDFLFYHNEVATKNYEVGGGVITDHLGEKIPGTNGRVKGLQGDVSDTLIKFGWNIDNNQRLAFSYENYQDEGDYSFRPDMGLATDLGFTDALNVPLTWPTAFTRDTVTLSYDLLFGDNSQLKASVFSNVSELARDEQGWKSADSRYHASAGFVTGEAKNTGANVLIETYYDVAGVEHEIIFGGEALKHETDYTFQPFDINNQLFVADSSQWLYAGERSRSVAAYLQDKIAITDNLSFTPGIRHQQVSVQSSVVSKRYKDTTLSFAGEYQFTPNLLAKASVTELFKAPELAEVFVGAGRGDKNNSQIKAESGTNKELSLAFKDNILGADRFSAGITYFNTAIENYIFDNATVPGTAPGDRIQWKDNIGDMKLDGIETYVGYQKGNLETLLTYSTADSELSAFADYSSLEGARIDRKQGDTYSASFKYQLPALTAFVNWEIQHVQDLSAGIDLGGADINNHKDGFTIHNIAANWQPKFIPGATLVIGVDNLFDEFYVSQSSRTGQTFHPLFIGSSGGVVDVRDYEPGRNIKATIAYKF